nr:hypothetical protein [Neorhizobium lilium]
MVSTMETSMLNCCYFAAAAGMGVSIVDYTSLRSAVAQVVAIPFEPRIEVSYFAIRPTGAQRIAVLDDLIGRMRKMMSTFIRIKTVRFAPEREPNCKGRALPGTRGQADGIAA